MGPITIQSLFRGGIVPTLMAAVLLLGCQANLESQRLPELTYGHLAPLTLKVGAVETVIEYQAPLAAPNVDHLFPVRPTAALRQWAADRLKVSAGAGAARFIITNASVVETPLPLKKGLTGALTKEQSERYEAKIEATLEVIDNTGSRLAFAEASVKRSITVREDANINERELIWFKLIEALMKDFDAEMEKNIKRHLRKWLNS